MCIMLLKRAEQAFHRDYIESIYDRGNRDGFGLAYVEGERNEEGKLVKPGRVKVVKSMGFPSELKKIYDEHKDKNLIMHLRNATAGDKNEANCHPYWILNIDEGDPIDLVMMHNGTIRDVQLDRKMSDSWNFASTHLKGILRERPSMMYEEAFRFFLCWAIGANKLIFLDNRERVTIINFEMGSMHEATGVWLSTKENLTLPKPYVVTPPRNFQLGADHGSPTPLATQKSNVSDVLTPAGEGERVLTTIVGTKIGKMTWKQPDGAKWVMEQDGRSHFLPANASLPESSQLPLVDEAKQKEDKDKTLLELIGKSKMYPPKSNELEALRKNLGKASQADLHSYVQEYPAESAILLGYIADTTPLLPELKGKEVKDLLTFCIDEPWNAGYGLLVATRINEKEKVHEVN